MLEFSRNYRRRVNSALMYSVPLGPRWAAAAAWDGLAIDVGFRGGRLCALITALPTTMGWASHRPCRRQPCRRCLAAQRGRAG